MSSDKKPNATILDKENTYQVIQLSAEYNVSHKMNWAQLSSQKPRKSFYKSWMLLLLPILVAIIFFYMFVPDRYISSAKFIIKQSNSAMSNNTKAISVLALGADASKQDALMLQDYIQSEKVFNVLDQKFYLKERFRQNNLDTMLRLSRNATQEEYLNYYHHLLVFEHDVLSNVITVKVQAFDAKTSQDILKEIIHLSENFLNNVSAKIAENQLSFAKGEVNNSKTHLASIKNKLQSFQDVNRTINPIDQTEAINKLIQKMEADLVKEEINLNKYRAYLSEASPTVKATVNAIATVKDKISAQKALLAGSGNEGIKLNTVNTEFEQLKFEEKFWQSNYLHSLKTLEISRIEAIRQIKFIIMVSEPSLAQVSEMPNRFYNIITLSLILVLLYGIGKLSVTTIRERRES